MKRSLVVCLLTAAIAGSALGANSVDGRFISFGPTVLFGDFSGLNDAFARQGIGKLSSTHATAGASGFGVFGRAVFGFAGWDGDQTVSSPFASPTANETSPNTSAKAVTARPSANARTTSRCATSPVSFNFQQIKRPSSVPA